MDGWIPITYHGKGAVIVRDRVCYPGETHLIPPSDLPVLQATYGDVFAVPAVTAFSEGEDLPDAAKGSKRK